MEELKKKIIFTVTNDLNYDQRMIRICSGLQLAGYDVELVGRKKKIITSLHKQPYSQKRLSCFFSSGKLFYLEYNLRLFFYLLFRQADIYAAVDLDTILPNMFAAKIKSRKLVFDAHEFYTEVPEVVNRKWTKATWHLVAKLCIPQADLCYTVSQSLADIFTVTYKNTFHVIRNVPLLKNKTITPNGKTQNMNSPVIFYQGDLNEGRGLPEIIKVMSKLDAFLYIAGDGPLMKSLEEQVHGDNLGHKIKFLGYLETEELSDATEKATVGLNLLANRGLSYYYSLSNKFFNYIHSGIPQLCADFPEYRLINEKYRVAMLFNLEKNDLVSALQQLLNNQELYLELETNCSLARQEFNWQYEEQKLLTLYNDLR